MNSLPTLSVQKMYKLRTSDLFNLISAIDDSTMLNWRSQSESDDPHQHPGWKDLPPLYDRQGTLQVWHAMIAFSQDPEFMKSVAEMNVSVENEAQK